MASDERDVQGSEKGQSWPPAPSLFQDHVPWLLVAEHPGKLPLHSLVTDLQLDPRQLFLTWFSKLCPHSLPLPNSIPADNQVRV